MNFFGCNNWCAEEDFFDEDKKFVIQDYLFDYLTSEQHEIDKIKLTQRKIKVKKSDYAKQLKKCKDKGLKFIDQQFPPNSKSLGNFKNKDKIQWKRISQILQKPKLIQGRIQPRDIMQGSTGDCYFLSALSSISQVSHRIEMVMLNSDIVKQGIYCFRLRIKGVPTQVYVDDFIPVKSGKPIFTKPPPGSNEIWVMLIQKVWAKVNKSYQKIAGGFPHDVLQAFSFGPCFYMNISKLENEQQIIDLRKKMINAQHQNYTMCVGSISNQKIRKLGIIPQHTYSVVIYNQQVVHH